MTRPRVCVLRAPGTNCDVETAFAFDACSADADRVHLFRLLENPDRLLGYQILCIPGGFSYGDDVGAGVILSQHLRGKLGDAMRRFLSSDRLMLGICNGFQVLLKSGILPGASVEPPSDESAPPSATLTWNENGRYTALWVTLSVNRTDNAFLRGIDRIEMPIAHAEGRFVVNQDADLNAMRERGQVALTYCVSDTADESAETPDDGVLPYPFNPNGSVANVAGLSDQSGRVLGLMPHPERFLHATQHPEWTRRRLTGEGEGMRIFRNAVDYFAS